MMWIVIRLLWRCNIDGTEIWDHHGSPGKSINNLKLFNINVIFVDICVRFSVAFDCDFRNSWRWITIDLWSVEMTAQSYCGICRLVVSQKTEWQKRWTIRTSVFWKFWKQTINSGLLCFFSFHGSKSVLLERLESVAQKHLSLNCFDWKVKVFASSHCSFCKLDQFCTF